jgi:hypothetical protein
MIKFWLYAIRYLIRTLPCLNNIFQQVTPEFIHVNFVMIYQPSNVNSFANIHLFEKMSTLHIEGNKKQIFHSC